MNKIKFFMLVGVLSITAALIMSADHIDAPAVSGTSSDATDLYVFQSPENSNNLVFAVNTQGLLSPMSTASASFDENVLIEFNIDNDGDLVEDLVLQGIARDNKMIVFGPYPPASTGTRSTIDKDNLRTEADITAYGESAIIGSANGIKVFAGPRDDPFFFDLGAYTEIINGNAGSFNDPGTDTFAGTNVLSFIVEVPKSLLGNSDTINVWVETKTKV